MAAITYDTRAGLEKPATTKPAATGKGFLRRFFDAIVEARLKQAERELALHRHLLPEEFEIAGHKVTFKNEDLLPFQR
jgi:hypothetical protein